MGAYFLDSSAAVKLFVVEPGTPWITKLVDPVDSHEIFVVRITPAEITAALFRRVKAGSLLPGQASAALG
ncbi:MAG: type II toxin-antitoxin system VapC family toxin [Chloroflexi bacterium]|nr:type II toxin-antitoxin system VapC family toxin [Chloroflexota bacterium]